MSISRETVQYVAHLARISLSEQELKIFAQQLNDIIGYIDQLKEVDVSKVEPTAHVLDMQNVQRDDVVTASLDPQQVLQNAPSKEKTFFKVPKVIE